MTDVPVGYKQTEVGIIPNDWKVNSLFNISGIFDGTHQTPQYTSSGIKFASVENIKSPFDTEKYISEYDYEVGYKVKIKPSDVLMTRIGSVGDCYVIDRDEPLAYYVSLALLKPKAKDVNSYYLKYYLESSTGKKELDKRTLNYAVPKKINKDAIGYVLVSLPKLEEQQAIATTLSDMDELISNLDELIKKKKNIKKGAMQKLLSPKEGWIETILGKLCNITTGTCVTKAETNNGKYPIISGGVLPLGLYDKYNCDKDTVTIARAGTAGYVNYIKTKFWLNDKCFSIIPKKHFSSLFLYYYLKFNEEDIKGLQAIGTVPTVNIKNLSEYNLIYPSTIEEQQAIASILSDMDKEIEALEEKKAKYEQIKQGAMQKLLTGKIRLV